MKRRKYALCALKGSRAGAKAKGPRRQVTADRFRDARHLCLLSIEAAADLLGVCPRTVRNWEAGKARVPYAAFKLMRILRAYELPGRDWDGWKLVGDTLYSPEGHGFKATDHGWWSLLVRRAQMFGQLLAERDFLRSEVDRLRQSGQAGRIEGAQRPPRRASVVHRGRRVTLSVVAVCDQPDTVDGGFSPVSTGEKGSKGGGGLGPGSNTGQKTASLGKVLS